VDPGISHAILLARRGPRAAKGQDIWGIAPKKQLIRC
jgi:hypothetical protein